MAEPAPAPEQELQEAPSGRYAALAEKAEEFIRARGGAVHEDALVMHVFGSGTSAKLWRPLLRQALGSEEGLELRADGFWSIRGLMPAAGPSSLYEFVAIDVETTGLKPSHQRVIEIAAIRYRDGVEIDSFDMLLNPGRRIPKYIVQLTSIRNEDVEEEPTFPDIAERFVEFVGSSIVVGHNIGFDLGFINAELKRADHPIIVNERIDTLTLANRLLPAVRRPNLDTVATTLGLEPRKIHRAGIDARLTAEVALRLAILAQATGHGATDELKSLSTPYQRRPPEMVGHGRSVLDRSLLSTIPKLPGVYLMKDEFGTIVYVGKAKNLRDRVASYFAQPLGYTRKMDGLLEAMVAIDTVVTGSEIEALLLEVQLIQRYQPRYNTQLRRNELYPYIRLDVSNAWPRLTLSKERKDDGAHYFGPFRSRGAAKRSVELINTNIPLRTCPRSFKDARSYGKPCIQLDLGRCLGPCVGRADRGEYLGLVQEVLNFLDGESEGLYQRLWASLEDAAEKLDFERARQLRNDVDTLKTVAATQRSLRAATERHTLLFVLPSIEPECREVLLVTHGRLWAQMRGNRRQEAGDLAKRLGSAWERFEQVGIGPINQGNVDTANLLNRWLARYAGHPAILPIPVNPEPAVWSELAAAALALSDEDLVFHPIGTEPGEDILGIAESLPNDAEPFEPENPDPAALESGITSDANLGDGSDGSA